jgi:hypothetical protein
MAGVSHRGYDAQCQLKSLLTTVINTESLTQKCMLLCGVWPLSILGFSLRRVEGSCWISYSAPSLEFNDGNPACRSGAPVVEEKCRFDQAAFGDSALPILRIWKLPITAITPILMA